MKAYAVFIASLGDEAARTLQGLPTGRGYVCMDTGDLPHVFKKIFTAQFGV